MSGLIVHEWLEPAGGAEKVVDRLAGIYPDASLFTLWNDAPGRIPDERVDESWLARTPFRRRKALALPLMPATWRQLPRQDADWMLCSSHLFAHHAKIRGNSVPKFVYAYTPARYIWAPEVDSRGDNWIARAAATMLRPLDKRRAHEATSVAAISKFVAGRIDSTWGVDSEIIYPPVAVADFADHVTDLSQDEQSILEQIPADFILGASRLVPYKRLDDVIRMGDKTGIPVVIAGSGPDLSRLQSIADAASVPVKFIAHPSHSLLVELYRRALAYVFPAIEDFGIMPVEAMAVGTPVIGPTIGGVAETVTDAVTGHLIEDFGSTNELRAALEGIGSLDKTAIKARAWDFDEKLFDSAIVSWIDSHRA